MTPFSEVYEAFLDRINRDTEFFIQDEDIEKVQKIADIRMRKLLDIAIYELMISEGTRDLEINFMEILDKEANIFTEELTLVEIQLLADLMFQKYIYEEIIVRIDAMKRAGFEDSEIKIILHSPANALKEFNAMYESLEQDNQKKIKNYRAKSRENMRYKPFNFSLE